MITRRELPGRRNAGIGVGRWLFWGGALLLLFALALVRLGRCPCRFAVGIVNYKRRVLRDDHTEVYCACLQTLLRAGRDAFRIKPEKADLTKAGPFRNITI